VLSRISRALQPAHRDRGRLPTSVAARRRLGRVEATTFDADDVWLLR
jgi:hypothetical protein